MHDIPLGNDWTTRNADKVGILNIIVGCMYVCTFICLLTCPFVYVHDCNDNDNIVYFDDNTTIVSDWCKHIM